MKAFVVLSDKFSHVTGDEEKEKELKGFTCTEPWSVLTLLLQRNFRVT